MNSRLPVLKKKIISYCEKAKRSASDVTLIAVSKYATIDQIREAHDGGIVHFAENKVVDALKKMEALPRDIQWHFTGRIQSNKINKMIGSFCLIHSVADVATAIALSEKSLLKGFIQNILLQVRILPDPSKQGFSKQDLEKALPSLVLLKGINILGLMTIPPKSEDFEVARNCFSALRDLRSSLQDQGYHLPELSMGMSADFEVAIEQGATFVRIGSLIFN